MAEASNTKSSMTWHKWMSNQKNSSNVIESDKLKQHNEKAPSNPQIAEIRPVKATPHGIVSGRLTDFNSNRGT